MLPRLHPRSLEPEAVGWDSVISTFVLLLFLSFSASDWFWHAVKAEHQYHLAFQKSPSSHKLKPDCLYLQHDLCEHKGFRQASSLHYKINVVFWMKPRRKEKFTNVNLRGINFDLVFFFWLQQVTVNQIDIQEWIKERNKSRNDRENVDNFLSNLYHLDFIVCNDT